MVKNLPLILVYVTWFGFFFKEMSFPAKQKILL